MATISTTNSTALPAAGSTAAGKAYFLTDNNKFVVNTGSAWIEVHSDGTGEYSFNISTYATEQGVADIGLTSTATEGDIVYARDTDSFYVARADTNWSKFTFDS